MEMVLVLYLKLQEVFLEISVLSTVTSAGTGYGAGTTVSFNTLAGAVPPTNIVPTITNGSVASIAISNPGSGYTTTAPIVTITGTGTNATAEAILSAGGF